MQTDINEFSKSLNEDDGELIKTLQLDVNQNLSTKSVNKPEARSYHARKLDGRLKKYEYILKNAEKISRVEESQVYIDLKLIILHSLQQINV